MGNASNRALRWLKRIALTVLVLLLLALGTAWWLLRGSLPQLEGEWPLANLSAPVAIQRDKLGVVTIDATNETDAMRALGYVHAQERYFEMDLTRRSAAGELAAVFGARAVDLDKRIRMHRMRSRARRELAGLTAPDRRRLQAYAQGVNAGLAALRQRPWAYLLLGQTPTRWTAEDSMLVGYAMYFDLQDEANTNEAALAAMRPHLPAPLFQLLTRDGTRWDAPLMGRVRGDAEIPGPEEIDLRTLPTAARTAMLVREPTFIGSNNFAVSGKLTDDGRAILADDMHLGLRAPNIWFRARLRYPDAAAPGGRVDVQGFTLAGQPAVIVGSNGHVAWGFTNSYIDSQDWAVVDPCDAQVAASADCTPVHAYQETIAVAGAPSVAISVQETDWGPILEKGPEGKAHALRWLAHLPGSLNLELGGLAKAANMDEALAIADRSAIPTQNLLLADRDGRVAWRLLGPIPARAASCDGAVPQPLDTCPPWSFATDRSPALVDPPSGRLWTANARVVDGALLDRVGDAGYARGARARQIRDGLFARERFSERDLLGIQLDDRAVFLAPWWKLLQSRARASDATALDALAEAASRWEGRADVGSVSYRIVRAWRLEVVDRIAQGFTAPARAALGDDFVMPDLGQFEGVAWPLVNRRPAHLLPPEFKSWDALFEDAAVAVRDELAGPDALASRRWGERNTARICHPLADAIPLLGTRMLCMPRDELAGDSDMPRVAAPSAGASERMVVSPGHEQDGIIHMPGGQSGHPLSPFWGAGHDDWVHGRPTPFLPGEAAHVLTLAPANAR